MMARASISVICLILCLSPSPSVAQERGATAPGRIGSVESLIAEARVARTPRDREELLAEARRLLDRLIRRTADATDDEGRIEHLRLQVRLAELDGLIAPEPYASRLVHLCGTDEDRLEVLQRTAGPLDRLRRLAVQIEQLLGRWRNDDLRLITTVPLLEDLHGRVRYRLAWVAFYRGLATPDDDAHRPQKRKLLEESLDLAGRFARLDDPNGITYEALLLMGRVTRELAAISSQPASRTLRDQAASYLQQADSSSAPIATRCEAKFETARNLIEQGLYDRAASTIDQYERFCKELGPAGGDRFRALPALARSYMYRHRAARQSDPNLAARFDRLAQQAILAPAAEDPSGRWAYLRQVVGPYRGRADLDRLDPWIIVALAEDAARRGISCDGPMERALRGVLSADDAHARQVQPEATWWLGSLLSKQGRIGEAGPLFLDLARRYPQHEFAYRAALNACACFARAEEGLGRTATRPAGKSHLLEALEVLLGNEQWRDRPQAAAWNYDLGRQYYLLAERVAEASDRHRALARAVEAFGRAAATGHNADAARFWELRARFDLLTSPDSPARPDAASRLLGDLEAFAESVTARSTSQPAQKDDYREWAAAAEYMAAVVLDELLGRSDEALAILREFPSRWAGTGSVGVARRYLVRGLLDAARTDQAVEQLDSLLKQPGGVDLGLARYAAERLGRDLAEAIPDQPVTLSREADVYLRLCRMLYEAGQARAQGPSRRVLAMLADANLKSAQLSDAQGRRQEARAYYRRALELFSRCTPSDARTSLGNALAEMGLGLCEQARGRLAKLVSGMDPSRDDGLYWSVELAYCRALLACAAEDPSVGQALAVRIRQLQRIDPQMGGRRELFDGILAQAGTFARR